jgi:hypothetical protein
MATPEAARSPAARLRVRQVRGRFAVCRLPAGAVVPAPAGPLHCVVVTEDETSVICAEDAAPRGARVAGGWCALRVVGTFDFEVVGVMSRLSGALAGAGVPLLACSTFDTDYLLVHAPDLDRAADALRASDIEVELLAAG